MNFMILLICFVICNVQAIFYRFSDFNVFQYCEKCVSLNAKPLPTFNISTKQNFLSNKKSGSTPLREQRSQYCQFFALELHVWVLNYVHMSSYFTHIQKKTVRTTFVFIKKKNNFIKLIQRNLKDQIFDPTVELYCKVKNLIFQFSLNQLGHSLGPKRGVQVQKIGNIGFFAPKPYLKGVDPNFLFDRNFFQLRY